LSSEKRNESEFSKNDAINEELRKRKDQLAQLNPNLKAIDQFDEVMERGKNINDEVEAQREKQIVPLY